MSNWPRHESDVPDLWAQAVTFIGMDYATRDASLTVTYRMSDSSYETMRRAVARNAWREWYRAARLLGNRDMATERVGEQRSGFGAIYRD